MSYFVTGTDTGVGKTLVSCALLRAYAAQGKRVAGFKPVAAGCDAQGHNEDATMLHAMSTMPLRYEQVNPYGLREAVAPHLAAVRSGVHIEFAPILASYRELAAQAEVVVVEGAGGFLVPLNDRQNSADLARELGLPVILVVGLRLGCLNHALLTVEAVRVRGLRLAGWVANGVDAGMALQAENVAALQERIAAPLLGVIPYMPVYDVAAVALDIDLLGAGG